MNDEKSLLVFYRVIRNYPLTLICMVTLQVSSRIYIRLARELMEKCSCKSDSDCYRVVVLYGCNFVRFTVLTPV